MACRLMWSQKTRCTPDSTLAAAAPEATGDAINCLATEPQRLRQVSLVRKTERLRQPKKIGSTPESRYSRISTTCCVGASRSAYE